MRESWKRSVDGRGYRLREAGSLQYIIYLSNKYDIDPYELLDCFIEAEKKKVVICNHLKIRLRKREIDYSIFLLTIASEIIAQIRMNNKLLENPTKTKKLYSMLVDNAKPFKKLYEPPSSIKELRKGMKNIDLRVKVTKKSEVIERFSPYTGSSIRFCVATVSDLSGSVRLLLWNDQIDTISVGDEIDIKKAVVKTFQGVLQIVPNMKIGEPIKVNS